MHHTPPLLLCAPHAAGRATYWIERSPLCTNASSPSPRVCASYVNENVVVAVREANKIWDAKLQALKEEIDEEEERRRRVRKARIAALKHKRVVAAKELAARMDEKRADFRRNNMRIPNFDKAVKDRDGPACMHRRTKNWGHKYGKGITCLDCGIDLTDMQQLMDAANGPLDQVSMHAAWWCWWRCWC